MLFYSIAYIFSRSYGVRNLLNHSPGGRKNFRPNGVLQWIQIFVSTPSIFWKSNNLTSSKPQGLQEYLYLGTTYPYLSHYGEKFCSFVATLESLHLKSEPLLIA